MMPTILIRRGIPGKYDEAPYGTLCRVGETDYDLYVQLSDEEDCPKWALVGGFNKNHSQDRIFQEIQKVKELKI